MNKTLFLLVALSLIVVNQCSCNANINETKKESGYISLSVSDSKDVSPNIAKITFAVENVGQTAQSVIEENNEISNKIVTALKEILNGDTDVIKTNNISVNPVYNSFNGKRVIKNYTGVNSVTIQTKDIDKTAKLIDVAIKNGANRASGLSYNFENDKTPCYEMYPNLVKNVKEQADIVAKAAGTSVLGVKHISVSCSVDSNRSRALYFNGVADSVAESAKTSSGAVVEAGKVKVNAYVNAEFYVK